MVPRGCDRTGVGRTRCVSTQAPRCCPSQSSPCTGTHPRPPHLDPFLCRRLRRWPLASPGQHSTARPRAAGSTTRRGSPTATVDTTSSISRSRTRPSGSRIATGAWFVTCRPWLSVRAGCMMVVRPASGALFDWGTHDPSRWYGRPPFLASVGLFSRRAGADDRDPDQSGVGRVSDWLGSGSRERCFRVAGCCHLGAGRDRVRNCGPRRVETKPTGAGYGEKIRQCLARFMPVEAVVALRRPAES